MKKRISGWSNSLPTAKHSKSLDSDVRLLEYSRGVHMMRIFALIVMFSCMADISGWAAQTSNSESPNYSLSLKVVCQIRTKVHSLRVGMTSDEVNKTLGIDVNRRAVMSSGPLDDFRVSYFLSAGYDFLIVWDANNNFKRIVLAGNKWQEAKCPDQAQPNKSLDRNHRKRVSHHHWSGAAAR